MNFQIVDGLEGQKDGKGYQLGVSEMTATVREIGEAEYNKKGKHIQQVKLQDSQGRVEKVKVYLGNGPVIMPTDVGTLQMFQQVAPNRFKNNMYYMAFWDNMHLPQGPSPTPEITPTHLTAETQAIIDRHRGTAGQQEQDLAAKPPNGPIPRLVTQQEYEDKERKKVLGMCFTNLLSGRLSNMFAVDMEKDLGEIAALWRLAAICIDGTGQIEKSGF